MPVTVTIPLLILNALCSLFQFQCDIAQKELVDWGGFNFKYVMGPLISNGELHPVSEFEGAIHKYMKMSGVGDMHSPVVHTKSGTIQGYRVKLGESREYMAFTGVPYGESPTGSLRFRAPVMKKPWTGTWYATSPSPFCIQMNRGMEDCLYLNVYSPRVSPGAGLPVVIWIPAGADVFGRSKEYGPAYFMRENAVFIVPNYRLGVFGFLSTGDSASPGNWALKDIALAVEWTYLNVREFGGDPERIVIGGISSASHAAQSMLYTKHKARNYIKGVIGLSGSSFVNAGLDAVGRVQRSSDLIARTAGCPTSAEGKSEEMVKCLRKVDPYILGALQYIVYSYQPNFSNMLSPTIEPDVPGAFITTLPEVQYEQGLVPKIPFITTRAEDEASLAMTGLRFSSLLLTTTLWREWIPILIRNLGFRTQNREKTASKKEIMTSLDRIAETYFNSTKPPRMWRQREFLAMVKFADDVMFNAGHLKGIRLHHKLAPTYSYIVRSNFFTQVHPLATVVDRVLLSDFKSSHAAEFPLLFSDKFPAAKPGSDFNVTSNTIVNMFVNFARFGEPLHRTAEGKLVSLWKPITDMQEPWTLSLGLGNIVMVKDPLAGSKRIKIWDTVTF